MLKLFNKQHDFAIEKRMECIQNCNSFKNDKII